MADNVLQFKKVSRKQAKKDQLGLEKLAKARGDVVSAHTVIDIGQKRRELIQSERRNVTRTVMSQFIGVFMVLPKWGLQPVSVYDISEGGLAFDTLDDLGIFKVGEAVTLRIYLSHDSYFTFSVNVANIRKAVGEGTRRYGAIFSKNDDSYKTLFFFAKFLENVSQVVRKDNGDRLVGKIE